MIATFLFSDCSPAARLPGVPAYATQPHMTLLFAKNLPSRAPLLWLALSVCPAFAACRFDDSGLAGNRRCERDADCVIGTCIAGTCRQPSAPDEGLPPDGVDAGLGDDGSRSDTGSACPAPQQAACGGCLAPAQQPGQPCGDGCGEWQCATQGVGVTCVGAGTNACGGCTALASTPGTSCGGACATWACQGTEDVVCRTSTVNACGGCSTLPAAPNAPCGSCGGRYVCDGLNGVVCQGGGTNACGGCDTPPGAVLDTACACAAATTPDPAIWRCDGNRFVCDDRPDVRLLGQLNDTDTFTLDATDALQLADDVDLHYVRGIDVLGTDPLQPSVELRSTDRSLFVCAAWEYEFLGPLDELLCAQGALNIFEDISWCCDSTEGDGVAEVLLANPDGISGRLDVTDGADNDGGVLTILVTAETAASTCVNYQLSVGM